MTFRSYVMPTCNFLNQIPLCLLLSRLNSYTAHSWEEHGHNISSTAILTSNAQLKTPTLSASQAIDVLTQFQKLVRPPREKLLNSGFPGNFRPTASIPRLMTPPLACRRWQRNCSFLGLRDLMHLDPMHNMWTWIARHDEWHDQTLRFCYPGHCLLLRLWIWERVFVLLQHLVDCSRITIKIGL